MNKTVFRLTLAAWLVNSADEGQQMCFQETRVTNAGATSGSLTNLQCPSGFTADCHIFDVSVLILGQTGMPNYFLI